MADILLIDDNEDIGLLVKSSLDPHIVRHAVSISDAKAALIDNRFDLILIDVTLPDGDGFELCDLLSRNPTFAPVPKIFLTGKGEISEKVYGFKCGADDYITKPFHSIELRARVERRLERHLGFSNNLYSKNQFEFHAGFQQCFLVDSEGKMDLLLSPTEFRLFMLLIKNEDKVLSRERLKKEIWDAYGTAIGLRGIDSHIAHLRRKLGPLKALLTSVYGEGYVYSMNLSVMKRVP